MAPHLNLVFKVHVMIRMAYAKATVMLAVLSIFNLLFASFKKKMEKRKPGASSQVQVISQDRESVTLNYA